MRLINVNDLIIEILTHDLIGDDKGVDKMILDAPTVNAIPVEWIEKYIWGADTHEEKRALRKMYVQWKKENGIEESTRNI